MLRAGLYGVSIAVLARELSFWMSRPVLVPASNATHCVPELTARVHLVQRSKMSGDLPFIPLDAIWRGQEKHCLYILLLCYSVIALHDDFFCTFFFCSVVRGQWTSPTKTVGNVNPCDLLMAEWIKIMSFGVCMTQRCVLSDWNTKPSLTDRILYIPARHFWNVFRNKFAAMGLLCAGYLQWSALTNLH